MAGGIVFFVNQWTCFVENMIRRTRAAVPKKHSAAALFLVRSV